LYPQLKACKLPSSYNIWGLSWLEKDFYLAHLRLGHGFMRNAARVVAEWARKRISQEANRYLQRSSSAIRGNLSAQLITKGKHNDCV
jgi:hypothetical protein